MKRSDLAKGYSLTELMLVIAIIAVMSGLAAPRYANAVVHYRIEVATRRIYRDLLLVQARARATGTICAINFVASSSSYQLPSEKDLKSSTATYSVLLTDAPYFSTISSVNFGGDGTLQFNGFGVPDSGGTVTIRCGSLSRTITVDATSGLPTIQ